MLGGLITLALIGFDWMTALKPTSGRGLAHGLAQLRGIGSNQSNLLTSPFIHFWPLMFSSITYWPPWAKQWFTTNWCNLPPLVLLFTSPFLLPTIIYSVIMTSQDLAISNKPPTLDEAKMSVVLLVSLLQLWRGPLVWPPLLHGIILQDHISLLDASFFLEEYPSSTTHWKVLPSTMNNSWHFTFLLCYNMQTDPRA